jgi:hypothetical protein
LIIANFHNWPLTFESRFLARIRRLEQLALGLARETQLVGQADIFLYVERRGYLTALHEMCARLASALVALAKVRQRLDGYGR